MSFDGIATRAIVYELQNKILGGHVKKINQISAKQLTMQFYANGSNQLLLLSSDSSGARMHLSTKKYQNPETPPNFCMLLRKHLGQSRLSKIHQDGLDRTVHFTFSTHNELGDEVEKMLHLEIMGKYSNLILTDENGKVIEAAQRVSHDMSRVRQIYPGIRYKSFPSEKRDILTQDVHLQDLIALTSENANPRVQTIFYKNITGFSPVISSEICFRSSVDPEKNIRFLTEEEKILLDKNLQGILIQIRENHYVPCLYTKSKREFYPLPLYHLGTPQMQDPSLSFLIDAYTVQAGRDDRIGVLRKSLLDKVTAVIEKKERKKIQLERDYEVTLERESLREEADLLSSQVREIQKGAQSITVDDFFHENAPRIISLDPRKTLWKNIEAKYHQYSKLKTAHALLSGSLPELTEEIAYLHQIAAMLSQADSIEDLDALRREMEKEGILQKKNVRTSSGKKQPTASEPSRYVTTGGFTILVGKNNFQNDHLTLKIANKEDYFFHSKGIPGSHVILRTEGKQPSIEDIEAAAWLAATHSSQREEAYVDVDYTKKKNVYKAKGAKPGMVYYNDFRTITVNTNASPALSEKKSQ
ncbi:MAG: NFACT RNA binding domain-containing protein [Peptoniphilaceae bacterium]|nr:NFACT RNA binding domain-containing protein [Peptoniphilaceae bacterium]